MTAIILIHLLIFQSMFVIKNILLSKKIKGSIRGKNKEATTSIILFTVTIIIAVISTLWENINKLFVPIEVFSNNFTIGVGIFLLILNLVLSFLALMQMRDSWRVGITKKDKTELVNEGIFRLSRNPYFLSYIIMFIAYILLIANLVLIISSLLAVISIHKMIVKEEKYLESIHGKKYLEYKKKVPRYLFISVMWANLERI